MTAGRGQTTLNCQPTSIGQNMIQRKIWKSLFYKQGWGQWRRENSMRTDGSANCRLYSQRGSIRISIRMLRRCTNVLRTSSSSIHQYIRHIPLFLSISDVIISLWHTSVFFTLVNGFLLLLYHSYLRINKVWSNDSTESKRRLIHVFLMKINTREN